MPSRDLFAPLTLLLRSMDRKHRSGLSTALKRQRDPLSDTEDNVPSSSEVNDVQKRRRLNLLGEENVSPNKRSSSRDHLRCAELEVKPDTPALCSVRSRVQQLTQRREGGPLLAQRCLSDPGSGVPSIIIQEGFKEHHLIGEAEFSSRVERFNAPTTPTASPLPHNWCPRTLSNTVTNLQIKLEDSKTPSSKQASRIRQEREEELHLLRAQPIAENVFLKQRFSDSSLTEADFNVTGDEPLGVKDGSFTETSVTAKIHGVEPPIQDTKAESSSQDETNTAEMIDLMFRDVLEAAAQGRMEEEEGTEDYNSGIATVMRRKEKTDTELEKEKAEEGEDLEETRELDSSADELLTLPPSCILSPLSGSVEAVVTPMRLAASQPATPPSLPLTPEDLTTPTADSASLYRQDIHSNFEIDAEVYSLSHTSGNACNVDLRSSSRSRVTPRKLLSTIKRSNHSVASSTMPALNTRRTSHFSLVGSHKISLASLGQSKFPLDKIKFEGKIRRLLGDEFQEKVPFLSPLEGNIYLRLDSESHSNVQHQGFLTMFGVVNGFGAWHRRFFVLEGNHMSYWNHPNDQGSKAAEGSISLFSSSSQSVKPVKRDSCARPYTFELVSGIQTALQDDQRALAKCWFSADTREDRGDWMEKLNQVLLDLHTWTHRALNHAGAQPNTQPSSGNIRESSL